MLHARNRRLRNHRGLSVVFPSGFSVAFSRGISLFSGIVQRIITFPVDLHWNFPMGGTIRQGGNSHFQLDL